MLKALATFSSGDVGKEWYQALSDNLAEAEAQYAIDKAQAEMRAAGASVENGGF